MDKELRFKSAKDMLEFIQAGTDLYNEQHELYVFLYNDSGSIAYYSLHKDRAFEIAVGADTNATKNGEKSPEYWGAFLGPGGYIADDPSCAFFHEGQYSNLDACEDWWKLTGWLTCEEWYEQEKTTRNCFANKSKTVKKEIQWNAKL